MDCVDEQMSNRCACGVRVARDGDACSDCESKPEFLHSRLQELEEVVERLRARVLQLERAASKAPRKKNAKKTL